MALLEVKKAPDGRVLARRIDGRPLTPRDRAEAKQMIQVREDIAPIHAEVVEEVRRKNGKLRAVLARSALFEPPLWVVWDRSYEPKDNLAIYYAEELPLLSGKSLNDLKLIQETKLIFPGARMIQ
ncbi:MAG: hypothetical protein V3T23_03945 [Nitrososphaerales archaeon]